MDSSAGSGRKRRAPQRAVPQSIRRSGKPVFFGWGAHLTHHEREQVKERIAAAIGILLALAVIALLVNGWYQDNVARPAAERALLSRPVARVGGKVITNGWYHKVRKFRKAVLKSQLQQYQADYSKASTGKTAADKARASQDQSIMSQITSAEQQLSYQVMQELVDAAIVAARGPADGLLISKAAEQKYVSGVVKQYGGPANFAISAHTEGMSSSQLTSLILSDYKVTQMEKQLSAKVPTSGVEANVRHILVKTDALAKKIEAELKRGGSWKTLAAKYSTDPGSKTKGGELGWAFTSGYVPPFRNAANHQKINTIAVTHSSFGFHVLEVVGRRHAKVPASTLSSQQQQAFSTWVSKQEKDKSFFQQYYHPSASSFPSLGNTSGSSSLPSSSTSTTNSNTNTSSTGKTKSTGKTAKK